jgi:hypothetical protein
MAEPLIALLCYTFPQFLYNRRLNLNGGFLGFKQQNCATLCNIDLKLRVIVFPLTRHKICIP